MLTTVPTTTQTAHDPASPPLPTTRSHHQAQALYDRISGVYDLLAHATEEPLRRAGLRALAAQPNERILEIGPGTGHSLVKLANTTGPGGLVVGVDLSPGMLHEAAHLTQDAVPETLPPSASPQPWAQLIGGDAIALPFADGTFDGLFMSFVLELFDAPEMPAVLRECRRVLRPGGRLVVVGLTKEEPGWIVPMLEWTHAHFPSLMDCRPIYVQHTVAEAGFQIREIKRLRAWVPVEIVCAEKIADA